MRPVTYSHSLILETLRYFKYKRLVLQQINIFNIYSHLISQGAEGSTRREEIGQVEVLDGICDARRTFQKVAYGIEGDHCAACYGGLGCKDCEAARHRV